MSRTFLVLPGPIGGLFKSFMHAVHEFNRPIFLKMPKTSSYKKKTAKRTTSKATAPYKKRSYALSWHTNAIARPKFPSTGLGTSTTTILKTSFFYNATANGGTGVYNGYIAPGSCFDPTGDMSTIQPALFDQFAAIYSRYKVNSCKIRIKITGNSAGANNAAVWVAAAYPAVDSTALTTYQAAGSQQYAKTTSGVFQQLSAGNCPGGEGKYLSFDLNHNAVVGSKSDTWDIGALVTQSPLSGQFMVLPILLQGNVVGAHGWVLEIDMWQNVTFSQKKNTVDA